MGHRNNCWKLAAAPVALALLAGVPAQVMALDLGCPRAVDISEQTRNPPAGWEGFVSADPHTFERVSLYFHHPREMGSQVPDNEGASQPPRWVFAGVKSEEYWVACEYHGTNARLVKQLPAGLAKCSATENGVRCK